MGAKANEAAEIAYKAAWRAGARIEPGSPCASAEASFRSNYDSGKDTITNAALAFAKSWPGLEEGNPCSVSSKTYMESIIGGKSIDDAGLSAAKAFIGAFADLAKSGNAVVDASCTKAAKEFIRNSNGPDSAASDAAQAFIDATLSSSSNLHGSLCRWQGPVDLHPPCRKDLLQELHLREPSQPLCQGQPCLCRQIPSQRQQEQRSYGGLHRQRRGGPGLCCGHPCIPRCQDCQEVGQGGELRGCR